MDGRVTQASCAKFSGHLDRFRIKMFFFSVAGWMVGDSGLLGCESTQVRSDGGVGWRVKYCVKFSKKVFSNYDR